MRIGILGGRFDPIHIGHLIVAQDVAEILRLDRILFLVSHNPPHKGVLTSFEDRLRMVQLAVQNNPRFEASDFERKLNLPRSYTVQVLEALRKTLPANITLFFIMGEDQFATLDTWYQPDRLFHLAQVVVMRRPGTRGEPPPLFQKRVIYTRQRLIEISSSEIRRRVKAGQSITYLVPREVELYIRRRGLYR